MGEVKNARGAIIFRLPYFNKHAVSRMLQARFEIILATKTQNLQKAQKGRSYAVGLRLSFRACREILRPRGSASKSHFYVQLTRHFRWRGAVRFLGKLEMTNAGQLRNSCLFVPFVSSVFL